MTSLSHLGKFDSVKVWKKLIVSRSHHTHTPIYLTHITHIPLLPCSFQGVEGGQPGGGGRILTMSLVLPPHCMTQKARRGEERQGRFLVETGGRAAQRRQALHSALFLCCLYPLSVPSWTWHFPNLPNLEQSWFPRICGNPMCGEQEADLVPGTCARSKPHSWGSAELQAALFCATSWGGSDPISSIGATPVWHRVKGKFALATQPQSYTEFSTSKPACSSALQKSILHDYG